MAVLVQNVFIDGSLQVQRNHDLVRGSVLVTRCCAQTVVEIVN
jgi:hypothetical protein